MFRLWKTLISLLEKNFQKLAVMAINFKRVQIYKLVIPYKITSLIINIKACVFK